MAQAQIKKVAQESDFIKSEANGYTQTRSTVRLELAANVTLAPGTPIQWDPTANAGAGAFVPYTTGTPTGKTAILVSEVVTTASGIYEAPALYRGPAIVRINGVNFDPAATIVDKQNFIRAWESAISATVPDVSWLSVGPAPVFVDE